MTARRRALAAAAVVLLAAAAVIDVVTVGPRVTVRWADGVDANARQELEQRYSLRGGVLEEDAGRTWRYELRDWSRENVAALVDDPMASDTGYINRETYATEDPQRSLGIRPLPFPFSRDERFRNLALLFHIQSLCAGLAAAGLLIGARASTTARRRAVAILALSLFAVTAYAFPIDPAAVHMGDAETYTADRQSFEGYMVREVRFEAHLSQFITGRLYGMLGDGPAAPAEALDLMMAGATAWFVATAIAVGVLEGWSAAALRYLALVLLAPSAMLFFGYREFGHLSLNAAVFPLLVRGLAAGTPRLEAAAVLSGLGAALHAFGLLSLAGCGLGAWVARGGLSQRVTRAATIAAWGAATYLGWIAIYLVVFELPVVQGHAEAIPWRPWLVEQLVGDRVNPAIVSTTGLRDILLTLWVTGGLLVIPAVALARQHGDAVGLALTCSIPSVLFTIFFWPVQGLGVEMDLLVAAFPAAYALAWVCAQNGRRTLQAAFLLLSGHIIFWRILFDDRFFN